MKTAAWFIIVIYAIIGASFIAAIILKIIERIRESKKDKYKYIKK